MAIVAYQLPLVAGGQSFVEFTLFDLHDPVIFVGVKSWIVIAFGVGGGAPVLHEAAITCQRIFDVVK